MLAAANENLRGQIPCLHGMHQPSALPSFSYNSITSPLTRLVSPIPYTSYRSCRSLGASSGHIVLLVPSVRSLERVQKRREIRIQQFLVRPVWIGVQKGTIIQFKRSICVSVFPILTVLIWCCYPTVHYNQALLIMQILLNTHLVLSSFSGSQVISSSERARA